MYSESNMETNMTKYSVYQAQGSENRDLRFDVCFGDDPLAIAKEAFANGSYTFVSSIVANDLNHCFEIGNIGPESAITRVRKMASLSAGDILVDWKSGEMHLIANLGFKPLI